MKKQELLFLIIFMISHELFATSQQSLNTFLFCLKPELQPLTISLNRGKPSVGLLELDNYFQSHEVVRIEPWIKSATEMDRDGDIYLNRIYRVYLDENRQATINQSISIIQDFPFILYAEPEYVRKPYTYPDDYDAAAQCSIAAVKADKAWDYWNIPDDIPGSDSLLLASVDTGVDYTHPDLIDNIWVNQGEILPEVFEYGVDSDNNGLISASEISSFMSTQGSSADLNNDGISNLQDALIYGSPFLDTLDNDGNGYINDIIGWDVSGISGTADNDPFPKQGSGVLDDKGWSHGTHVAGILAAVTNNDNGIVSSVFNGKILSVKSSRENGEDINEPSIHDGYEGIIYAAKAGYYAGARTIINCSWGGLVYIESEQSVINVAYNTYGAIIVVAAGNGKDTDGDGEGDETEYEAHYPSSLDNIISVAAVKCNLSTVSWPFTYHKTVDLSAPGHQVYSTIIGNKYKLSNGSSAASPNAASVMGLVWSFFPEWSNEAVVTQIKLAADSSIYEINPDYIDCDGNEGSYCLGAGMVDAYKSIGQVFSPNIQAGPFTFTEISGGDSDGIINPGETGYLSISLKNTQGWADAENIQVVLLSENPQITIDDKYALYGQITAGDSLYNLNDTYAISVSDDIELGNIDFQLQISANSTNYDYERLLIYEHISVSLNQAGFPISTSEIRSSPLVIDFDNDGDKDIIFGDKGNSLHIFNVDGSEVENETFPFDTGSQIWGAPSAADIDRDGMPDFVITSKSKHLYIFDQHGLKTDYNSNKILIGTPAIGNLDGDTLMEIVFSGYSSSNQLFVINQDGSNVDGFPLTLNEKTKAGVALADFDGNGLDDIIFGTDSSRVYLIYDNANVAPGFPYQVEDKIQTSPSILNINGDKVIFIGTGEDSGHGADNNFYAINANGTLRFKLNAKNDIMTSPSFLTLNEMQYIFFGANDSLIYAVDGNGDALSGWPKEVNGKVVGSVVFADLDGNGTPEVVAATDAKVIALYLDGRNYPHFPISNDFSFTGSPMITDLDDDGDLEILAGSQSNLMVIDIKESGNSEGYWSQFRGGYERRGSKTIGGCSDNKYCNYDRDAIWDDGSCSKKDVECENGTLGCDCLGECNGPAEEDCTGECNGSVVDDTCGICGGDNTSCMGCTNPNSSNYDPEAIIDDESCILDIDNLQIIPEIFSISNIYPNPFNPVTHIRYSLPEYADVRIIVFNILGKQIDYLVNNFQSPGYHSIVWDASRHSSGIYFIIMEAGRFRQSRKVLLIK